jgi:GTP-binding protein EngB required for normal cell division
MNKTYYVYRHLCSDGRAYIGITTNPKRRWEANGCNYYDHPVFKEAIDLFGWENIEHKIIFSCSDKYKARDKEKKLAMYYQYYNLSLNAGNGHSHSPTLSTRQKVAEVRRKTTMTEETKEKIRQACKKRKGIKYFKRRIEI